MRRGMTNEEMLRIAEFMERAFITREKQEKLKRTLGNFVEDLQKIKHCLEQV